VLAAGVWRRAAAARAAGATEAEVGREEGGCSSTRWVGTAVAEEMAVGAAAAATGAVRAQGREGAGALGSMGLVAAACIYVASTI
jgi:hypothetical protein